MVRPEAKIHRETEDRHWVLKGTLQEGSWRKHPGGALVGSPRCFPSRLPPVFSGKEQTPFPDIVIL